MWLALVGALSAAGMSQLVWARRRALRQAPSDSADALLGTLRRMPPAERVAGLLHHAPSDSWEWQLAHAVAHAPSAFDRVDSVSERAADLDRALDATHRWLPVGAHASLLVAVLLAVVGALAERFLDGLVGGGIAALAALAALGAERRFGEAEAAKRILADRLVTVLRESLTTDTRSGE